MPFPCCTNLRNHTTASREYGGLHQTRPNHGCFKPSSRFEYVTFAVSHGMNGGQHGSRSNDPSARMIDGGVNHVSEIIAALW
jgi:hypothetical protein